MTNVRQIAWGSAVAGGLLGLALTLVFVLVVSEPLARMFAGQGATVMLGMLILVLALLRVVAGMWTAQLVRRRYEVRYRREFLPTALVAAVIGWAAYTVLTLVSGSLVGTQLDVPRLFFDVLPWAAEFGLGAFLINPEPADSQAGRGTYRR